MDYKQFVNDLENHKNDSDVKLPRSSHKYRVADFTIDNGDLKMVLGNAALKVGTKVKKRTFLEKLIEIAWPVTLTAGNCTEN